MFYSIFHYDVYESMISNRCKCSFVAFYRKLSNLIWSQMVFDDKSIHDDNSNAVSIIKKPASVYVLFVEAIM